MPGLALPMPPMPWSCCMAAVPLDIRTAARLRGLYITVVTYLER